MRGGPGGGTDCAEAKIAASDSRARFLRMITEPPTRFYHH
jgi:hypothetical protein